MIVGVKLASRHEQRSVYIVDPETLRGLILRGTDFVDHAKWEYVGIGDAVSYPKGNPEFLAKDGYVPMELPGDEFNKLYNHVQARTSDGFRERLIDDFSPTDTPHITELVEQSIQNYILRVDEALREHREGWPVDIGKHPSVTIHHIF